MTADDWQRRFDESVAREEARIAHDEAHPEPIDDWFRFRAYFYEGLLFIGGFVGSLALVEQAGWWRGLGIAALVIWTIAIVSVVGLALRKHR